MDHRFKIIPVEGSAAVTIIPGLSNGLVPEIGTTPIDDGTPPELSVVTGVVYAEVTFWPPEDARTEIKNAATMPANVANVSPAYVQIGTVTVSGSVVTVTAQTVRENITVSTPSGPWRFIGYIDGGAKISVAPGMVNNSVPTIGGVSLAATPAPALTVTGASGIVQLKATVDAVGTITDLIAESVAGPAVTASTTTLKYKLVGSWTASGGAFTGVTSILDRNQTLYLCNGTAIWES